MADDDKSKLTEAKERWAAEGRLLTGHPLRKRPGLLPPGQHTVTNWPVLDLGRQPDIDKAAWRLKVDGLVEQPLDWDWAAFMAQPQIDDVSDMHCVTSWTRFNNHWQGVSAKQVLALARPKPAARFVLLHSYDNYTTNLPLSRFLEDDVLLVHTWEGKPIPREHGGPVRALVPQLYLWKSAKWLKRIELIAENRHGFWEDRGYHDIGNPWREQRYG